MNKVKGLVFVKNDTLKAYKHRLWDVIEDFSSFNIVTIPRKLNQHADRLAAVGAQFDIPINIKRGCDEQHIKIIVRPSIPDNNINWQVFESDEQILQFLLEEDVFAASNQDRLKGNYEDQVVQLKSNKFPKGLVTLESIFNTDDQAKKNKTSLLIQQEYYADLEIELGKTLKFGKVVTDSEK